MIEITGRFIGKQHIRIAGKGAGDGYPLLLATGQLRRVMAGTGLEANPLQQLQSLTAGIALTGQLQRQHDVFQRRQTIKQLEGLKHEADPLRPQQRPPILIKAVQIDAGQPDPAGTRCIQPGQQAKQG